MKSSRSLMRRAYPRPQRNRSSSAGRRSDAAPGPSSSVTRWLEPSYHHRGLGPRPCARARSAAAATASAVASAVARSSRPLGVGPPAPVVQRQQPGGADRHVHLAQPPGPAERVADHHGGPPREAGAQLAGRAVGVGRQQDRVALGGVGLVHAPRWRRSGRGGSRRSARRGRRATAWRSRRAPPAPAAGPCRARRPARGRARRASTEASSRTRPSALDTTLWATTSTSPRSKDGGAGQQRAPGRRRRRPRAGRARHGR